MWDTSPLDESLTRTLPFESTVFTYIRVRPSPLVSIIMKGSPTTVSRGKGQLLTMEPYLYSMDPDFPELTYIGMEFRWYCREESESWPMNGSALSWNTRYPVPTQKLPPASITNNTQKGCFGYGPGPLDVKEGILSVPTGVFVQAGKNYEFMLILMKDVRNSTSKLLLTTVAGVPPVLEIACAEPSLCPLQASTGQVFINPTSRLGLRASCSNKQGSDCTGPLTYNWVVKDPTTLAPLTAMTNSLYFLGCSMVGDVQKCTSDLGMLVKMFQDFPRDEYIIELKGVNNLNTTGMIGLKLKVNKPPQGGSCLVIPPEDVSLSDITSLVDESEFVCSGWIDPEDIGIAKYTLFSTDANGKQATVVSLARFSPDVPTLLRLSPGKFNFKVVINDVWAASTEYIIPGLVEVKVPTPAQLLELETSGVMDQAMASQDSSLVMAILNAKMAILSDESNVVLEDTPANMNLSPEQKQELVSATIGQKKIEAMDSLVSNGATVATSPQSLSAVSQTLSNILGAPPEDGKPSTLGLEVVTKVVSISEGLVESLSLMDISTPELLKPMAISVVDNIGKVMSILMPDKVEPEDGATKNESASALCEKISPVDKANANKPGTDYETEVGDDLTMTIPEDLKAQQCKGLAAATSTAGDTSGSKITDMIDDLSKLLLSKSIIGEEFNIDTKNIKILTKLVSGEDAKKEFEVPQTGVFIKLPDTFCLEVQINNTCEAPVGISAVVYYKNPRPDGLFSDRLAPDTLVLDCKLSDKNHQSAEVSEIYDPPFSGTPGIRFTIPRKISTHQTIRNMTLIKAKVESKSRRIRPLSHLVPVPKADSTITIEIDPIDVEKDHNLTLFISHEKIPTYNSFEFTTPVKDLNFTEIGVRYWFLNNAMVKNRTGSRWFLTVMDLKSALTVQEIADKKFSADKISDFRADYKLRTYTSGCYFLDEKFEIWSGRALEVVETTYNQTVCVSAHMTLFAAGFFVQPNSMDFDFILKEMDFFDNETIYSTILITCIAYLLFLIVARFVDYTDVQRVGCKPLPDNNAEETYAYEILVLTGAKSESTCKSKVYFVLNGDKNETDVRQFPNGPDDYFERGGIDSFVMTVSRPLGNLSFLRIWHDNSGIGDYASWFLGAIIIRDLQTKQKYQFFNDRWLAIEKDDGEIERIIPLAGDGSPLKSTFQQSKENNLKQNHLWLASFFRPPRSRFTSWYSIIDIRDSDQVSLGLVDLTLNEVFVGLAANLVSFPIVLLITILFKYSKSRTLRKNRIVRALNLEDEAYTIVPNIGLSSADGKKKKNFLLPWFCSVLGWLLCLLSIVVSVYFLVTFGVVLGNQKVHRWLGCFFVTFFSSFLIVEPIKVVIYAVVYQVVCKMDLDDDLDDSEADEESVMINHDPEWDSDEKIIKTKTYIPYSEEHLENLRKSRIKELKSQAFAKEIITYIIFLVMIYIISVDNRDKNSIFLKNQIEKNFILKNKFHEIVTTDDYWKWVHSTLLSELKAGPLYNGDPPYGLRGFIGDHTQRILGFATLRQVRIKRNSCTVAPSVVDLTKECAQLSNLINEEKKDFCNAWEERTELTKGFPSCQSAEFRYKTDVEMQGWPISAWRDTYSGGGYVVNLKGTNAALSDRLQYLQEQHWINNQTRAVLLEFGTYNVNLNLFSVVTIAGEWLPGGGVSPYWRIDPIRLITVFTFFGTLAVISQIGCIGFILYFMLREITKMFKMKMEYWKSYWAYVEVGIVLDAFAAVGLFLYRNMLTQEIMKIFAETYGNGFIRLQWVGMIDEYYGYTIGLLMFMAVLKLLKILEFNNKMSLLNFTLLRCWESLSGFLVIFFFAFFSFVQMFYFILYSDMKDFSDIGKAFKTCSTMMLNKFDFGELLQTSQTAAIMFFVYAVAVNTLLINVLLTIIIEGYEEVKAELEGRKNELEVIQYMKDVIKFMVGADKRPNFLEEFSPEGLKNEQLVINKDDEALDQEEEENVVDELPEKVDEILQYINSTYFDGELDLKTKKMFEKGMRNQEGTTGLEILGVDDL
ncbi:uncharacterized protein LOC111704811 [Eurytemora carolleeae]|uniref:uncharacterized protein LOC111704811 n=1 Tax=Eurytemora carolleeae TaxID=1294199 RepID=UPI000C79263C|nr:uncharacterized protein LOC111704811 [Eurytemora carolleeae]|eukprot:XP_023332927.1 uncharacterized protein LOC111704811 [Eurytemora affinis]